MNHQVTANDKDFTNQVESCGFPVAEFSHRAHLRLAYVYLVENDIETSVELIRNALTRLLIHAGIEPSAKYHQTLTEAWVLAVHHFMNHTDRSTSADDFIDQHPEMLDSKIMMTHYSEEVLFSDEARQKFVQPDRDPIPRHDG